MSSSEAESRAEGILDGLREHERGRPRLPTFKRYDVEARLGEGGAAVVYRARDRELGRIVALKVLREPMGASDVVRSRFQREAHVTAGLSHPNVVAVHDAGEEDGRLFLIMELVDGRPLSALLEERPRDPGHVAMLEKIARGVGAAHARGVVHRDLKPSNILVTQAGEPKVTDFGLAQVAGGGAKLTGPGAVVGTPLYMAPEQGQGRNDQVSRRTDVYALGAILYEMLTGRPPHVGDSVTEIYSRIAGTETASARS